MFHLHTAVSQLGSTNRWLDTGDYTCNFDSDKGRCLWDIQGKSLVTVLLQSEKVLMRKNVQCKCFEL